KGVSVGEIKRIQEAFARGVGEVFDFTDTLKLDQVRLSGGEVSDRLKATSGVKRDLAEYTTGAIMTGSSANEVPAFQGAVKFTMSFKRLSTTTNIDIDLGG